MLHVENIAVSGDAHVEPVKAIVAGELEVEKWTAREGGGLYATWEWAIPAAVVFVITKAAFEGFFKEFGSIAGKATIKVIGDTVEYVRRKIDPRMYSSKDLRLIVTRLEHDGKRERLPGDYDDIGKKLSLLSMRIVYDQDGIDCAVNLIFGNDCSSESVQAAMIEFDKIRHSIYRLVSERCAEVKRQADQPTNRIDVRLVFSGDHLGWRLVQGRELKLIKPLD